MLKGCTLFFAATGFLIGVLSLLTGNTMSVNGRVIEGWQGVLTVTLALGFAGFIFGLVWYLVFRAIGIASE